MRDAELSWKKKNMSLDCKWIWRKWIWGERGNSQEEGRRCWDTAEMCVCSFVFEAVEMLTHKDGKFASLQTFGLCYYSLFCGQHKHRKEGEVWRRSCRGGCSSLCCCIWRVVLSSCKGARSPRHVIGSSRLTRTQTVVTKAGLNLRCQARLRSPLDALTNITAVKVKDEAWRPGKGKKIQLSGKGWRETRGGDGSKAEAGVCLFVLTVWTYRKEHIPLWVQSR